MDYRYLASDRYMMLVTAFIYWSLVVCWSAIIIFYARQYLRFKRIYPLLTTLLIVLFIDGTRTLIESIYFGARYTARTGIIPRYLYAVLDQPLLVAIPKTINLIAALIIIVVIVRRWFHSLEQEEKQRRSAEKFRSELISLASHEMRTPLTAIRGYASTLVREFGHLGEETQKEFLEGIASESERLSHLISDLLDMSQIEEGRLRLERLSGGGARGAGVRSRPRRRDGPDLSAAARHRSRGVAGPGHRPRLACGRLLLPG